MRLFTNSPLPPTLNIDLLQEVLQFAAECEADIDPKDCKRLEKKILT